VQKGIINLRDPSSRWLAAIVLAVLAVALLSLAVILLNRSPEVASLPENTPEGTVQRYLQALKEGDYSTAFGFLSPELQQRCDYLAFRQTGSWNSLDGASIALENTESLKDGRSAVKIRVTESRDDFPFGNTYSHTQEFLLSPRGEGWQFDAPAWPQSWCPEIDEKPIPAR